MSAITNLSFYPFLTLLYLVHNIFPYRCYIHVLLHVLQLTCVTFNSSFLYHAKFIRMNYIVPTILKCTSLIKIFCLLRIVNY